jgi:hypothetical protein
METAAVVGSTRGVELSTPAEGAIQAVPVTRAAAASRDKVVSKGRGSVLRVADRTREVFGVVIVDSKAMVSILVWEPVATLCKGKVAVRVV